MKAWVYHKEQTSSAGLHIFQEDVSDPRPGRDQLLIRIEKVSVCGTDETLFKGDLKRVPDGMVPGHEFYGEIVEVGSEVKGFSSGQNIAGESHYHASGSTEPGIIGLWGPENHSATSPLRGAYAEYLILPPECAHIVPGELISSDFWPSLFEAVGNDYFLVKRVLERKPQHLGIFGCGPHGLFAQVFARHFAIPKVGAFEIDPFRRKFAADLRLADSVMDASADVSAQTGEFTGGRFFDVTLDMVGKQGQGFASCCDTTRDGGTIFLFGLFSDRFSIQGIPGNEIIFKMKELTIEHKGKTLRLIGITGREGIWRELIDTVSNDQNLQKLLMQPVTVMGTLDQLEKDTVSRQDGILKRAYFAFR